MPLMEVFLGRLQDYFRSCLCRQKRDIFEGTSWHLRSILWWRNRYFKSKHDVFQTPTECVLHLNTALSQDQTETVPGEMYSLVCAYLWMHKWISPTLTRNPNHLHENIPQELSVVFFLDFLDSLNLRHTLWIKIQTSYSRSEANQTCS